MSRLAGSALFAVLSIVIFGSARVNAPSVKPIIRSRHT